MAKRITLNQLGVMIENIEDKVDALGEGQKVLEDKVDTLNNGQKVLKDKVDSLDKKIYQVHESLKNEIKITAMAINEKLEEHMKQPSHAA